MNRFENHAPTLAQVADSCAQTQHPSIPNNLKEFAGTASRVVGFLLVVVAIAFSLSGCAMYEHRDGRGYTVRYYDDGYREPTARHVHRARYMRPQQPSTVVFVEQEKPTFIDLGKDSQIPRAYANFVSQRGVRTWNQRRKLCKESDPGYCLAPNVPHCHGAFCHAHPGGDKPHTH